MSRRKKHPFLKRLAVAAAALPVLFAAACQRLPSPGGDFQKNMHQSGFSPIARMCETDRGVYFLKDQYLYYLDKEDGKATVLCGRPDCSHNGSDCDAWLNAAEVWFSDGRLFSVTNGAEKDVVSIKSDGADRRMVQELQSSPGASPSSYTRPIYHRGYVYYVWNDTLYRVPLGGKKDGAEAIWSGDVDGELTLWADGDTVYFMAGVPSSGMTRRDTLFTWTPLGGVAEVWATPGGDEVGTWSETGVRPSRWYVTDGSIYFYLAGNGLWRTELESGETERLADTASKVSSGGAVVFSDSLAALIQDADHGGTAGETFYIYGLDGTFEKELPLDALYGEIGPVFDCAPLFITEGELYFAVQTGPEGEKTRLCRVSVDTGETAQIYVWEQ